MIAGRKESKSPALRQAARAMGVQGVYTDTTGQRRSASRQTLLAILRGLGEPASSADDAGEILARLRQRQRDRVIQPTLVAWDGTAEVELRLPSNLARRPALVELEGPEGEVIRREAPLRARQASDFEDRSLATFALPRLATGAWRLRVEVGSIAPEVVVLSAPSRLEAPGRSLGVFLPLHAARSAEGRAVGTYSDLGRLMRWAGRCGCDLFGVLPLLPTFLEPPAEPSPYAAATRLLPSELFADPLDPALGPPGASLRRELERGGVSSAPPGATDGRHVDYEAAWARQRRLLVALAADVRASDALRAQLEQFCTDNPLAGEYARFRARAARLGRDWKAWPAAAGAAGKDIQPTPEEQEDVAAFLCGQWLASRQLTALDAEGRQAGCRLYADWPIGVHGRSFDVWRFRELFAQGISVGAPPDDFSATGQNWGFAPMLPEVSRADGHAYFRRSLALQFEAAGAVRIDHVMGLHRLLWIPEGLTAADGAYVRYPVDEMYACVMIEAARHGAVVIGENLGCVPAEVNRTLRKRGFLSMRVAQFEVGGEAIEPVGREQAAMLNTHDTPTFAGFVRAGDIEVQRKLGRIDEDEANARQAGRHQAVARLRQQLGLTSGAGEEELLKALLSRLAMSDASCLIVNLEDLWLEPAPQNTPGTSDEMPNWRRRAARTVEQIEQDPRLADLLVHLAEAGEAPRNGPAGE